MDKETYQEISDHDLNRALEAHYHHLRTKRKEGRCLDLRHYDLHGRNFHNFAFDGALLAGANLQGCHFRNCSFTYTDLSDVRADYATFDNCTFTFANLEHASMHETQHRRTIYDNVNFNHVRMDQSFHDSSEFRFCTGNHFDLSSSSFIGSRFSQGVFETIDLHDTAMDGTYLDSTSMYDADTTRLHLDSAILKNMKDFPILQAGPIPSTGQTSFYVAYNYEKDEVSCRELLGNRMTTLNKFRDTIRREKMMPLTKLFLKESFKVFDAAREQANQKHPISSR